jgi:hypothetical protein
MEQVANVSRRAVLAQAAGLGSTGVWNTGNGDLGNQGVHQLDHQSRSPHRPGYAAGADGALGQTRRIVLPPHPYCRLMWQWRSFLLSPDP